MRILVLTSSYPKFPGDGTAPFIERIVLATAARGHEIDVVLPRHPDLVVEGRANGLPVGFHPYGAGPASLWRWGYAESMRADEALRPQSIAVAPLAAWLARREVRRLLAGRRYDVVHAHWLLPSGAIAAMASGRGTPLVVSLHGSDVFVAERHRLLAAAARWTLGRAALVTACSHDLLRRARGLGADAGRLLHLPYGVDRAEIRRGDPSRWRERLSVPADAPLVVAVGRLVEKKGFLHLLRAIGRLRSAGTGVHLALAGEGDLSASLRDEVRSLGCEDAVRFLGALPHGEVGSLLAAADVVAVPSVQGEGGNVDGLPNVLLEAVAAGRPVVASRIAGIPDVIEDGRNGLLVAPADPEALAAALRRLAGDEALRDALARAAGETAERLSWSRYAAELEAGYRRAAGS